MDHPSTSTEFSLLGNFSTLDPEKDSPPPARESDTSSSDIFFRPGRVDSGDPFADERIAHWKKASEDLFGDAQETPQALTFSSTPKRGGGLPHSQFGSNGFGIDQGPNAPQTQGSSDRFTRRSHARAPIAYMEDSCEDGDDALPVTPTKRARSPMKKMFGDNGWLDRSKSLKDVRAEQPKLNGLKSWGGKLKQRVEDLTDNLPKSFNISPQKQQGASSEHSTFPISLDPPTQARLYSEVELMICVTSNTFLLRQAKLCLVSVESVVKVTEWWRSKGRPQVLEFQFDQATQRELVLANLKTLRFHGRHAEDARALGAMLQSWKSMAKEMQVRTFCYPDSVVRKHLHGIYKLLEMLGAPLTTFLAFQDMQLRVLRTMRDARRRSDEARDRALVGVERAWEPVPKPVDPVAMQLEAEMRETIDEKLA
ncbi:MAG: hypothetical protein M1825_000205 [Sarcosagium campestre]|nr:MAG: hypothetical protein M1825_000205 [Sarcosagium campestre]